MTAVGRARPILSALISATCLVLTFRTCLANPDTRAMTATTLSASHQKLTFSHSFEIPLPLASTFVFFEPVGEKLWATDWNPVFSNPADSTLGSGTVFTVTRMREGGAETSIWLITEYEPGHGLIEYRSIYPGNRVSRVQVRCRGNGLSRTAVTVTYTYTGLSEAGDRYISEITASRYRDYIDSWETEIRAYLKRGTPATP